VRCEGGEGGREGRGEIARTGKDRREIGEVDTVSLKYSNLM